MKNRESYKTPNKYIDNANLKRSSSQKKYFEMFNFPKKIIIKIIIFGENKKNRPFVRGFSKKNAHKPALRMRFFFNLINIITNHDFLDTLMSFVLP